MYFLSVACHSLHSKSITFRSLYPSVITVASSVSQLHLCLVTQFLNCIINQMSPIVSPSFSVYLSQSFSVSWSLLILFHIISAPILFLPPVLASSSRCSCDVLFILSSLFWISISTPCLDYSDSDFGFSLLYLCLLDYSLGLDYLCLVLDFVFLDLVFVYLHCIGLTTCAFDTCIF